MASVNSIEQLENSLKQLGYGVFKRDSSTRLVVYTSEERISFLKLMAATFDGTYTPQKTGPGWRSSVGAAQIGSLMILAKPQAKGGAAASVSSLDARIFTTLGTKGKFNYMGQDVSVVSFTKAKTLAESIVKGCEASNILGKEYAEMFEDFFETGKFVWAPSLPAPVVNKLGVYTGEVLVGWVLLANKGSKFFESNPFKGDVKAFHMPTDPAFSGVDSFVEFRDGTYIGISSKFGVGAKASFFTNMLEKGIKGRTKLKNGVFKDICDVCATNNIEYKKSKEIVYTYGVKKLLKLNITRPSAVFDAIVAGKKDPDLNKVVLAIKSYPGVNEDIKKKLPNSVSAFFNRTIADKLNKDQNSIEEIKKILEGKDFFQANLNINEWLKGNVKFKFVKSGKSTLKFIGSKSAIDDTKSKQGWINYELSAPK